eukprot:tig00020849_g14644.t1
MQTASNGFSPSSTLIRAVLTNGARMLGGAVTDGEPNFVKIPLQTEKPDKYQGWGQPTVAHSLRFADSNFSMWFHEKNVTAANLGAAFEFCVDLTGQDGGAAPFRTTLVYLDPAAEVGASLTLVNNMDLSVVELGTGKKYYPNGLTGPDNLNVVEQIALPASARGKHTVSVNVTTFASAASVGPALFTLFATGNFPTPTAGRCVQAAPSPSPSPSGTPSPSPIASPSPSPPGGAGASAGGGAPTPVAPTPVAPTPTSKPKGTPAPNVAPGVNAVERHARLRRLQCLNRAAQENYIKGVADVLSNPPPPVDKDRIFVTDVKEKNSRRRGLRATSLEITTLITEALGGSTAASKSLAAIEAQLRTLAASGGLDIPGFNVTASTISRALAPSTAGSTSSVPYWPAMGAAAAQQASPLLAALAAFLAAAAAFALGM